MSRNNNHNPIKEFIEETKALDWRIKILLISSILTSSGMGMLYSTSIFYITALGANEELYGRYLAITTIAALIAGAISSWLSDKYRRDVFIWIGTLVGFATLYLFYFRDLQMVLLGLIVFGISEGLLGPSMSAFFADITTDENRSTLFTLGFITNIVFSSMGSLVAAIYLQILNNQYGAIELWQIYYAGVVLLSIGTLPSFLLNDKMIKHTMHDDTTRDTKTTQDLDATSNSSAVSYKYPWFTPWIMLATYILVGLGAGFSIPFIPLFLKEIYSLDLSTIFYLNAVMGVSTGIGSLFATILSKRFGRIKVIALSEFIATLVLFTLVFHFPVELVLPMLVVRQAFMNMASPLLSTVIMSSVKRTQRAKWSIGLQFGWQIFNSIGMAVGGTIIVSLGYERSFLLTAILYMLSVFVILLIKEKRVEANKIEEISSIELA